MGIADELARSIKMPVIPSMAEALAKRVLEKVREIQAGLKTDEELVVYYESDAGEKIRVSRLQDTGGTVICVEGLDENKNATYVMTSVFAIKLICKVMKVKLNAKKKPIGFVFQENQNAS